MNRRLLLFPAAAITCWAQQANPAEEEARQALTARAREYYQLMVDKKYRQAESMVAEESKDDYYNGGKPDIRGFDVANIVFNADRVKATVTIKVKVRMLMPGAGAQLFEMASPSYWELQNGQWVWYIPEEIKNATPFGKLKTVEGKPASGPDEKGKAPEMDILVGQVTISATAVHLTADRPEAKITIENHLPGPVTLTLDPHAEKMDGLKIALDKVQLGPREKATVSVRMTGESKVANVVRITAAPLNRVFAIDVTGN